MEGSRILTPNLPPGFRFHPTDQELIIHYLKNKVSSSPTPVLSLIADIDLYKFNPWELPDKAFFGEEEWFFFSPRDRKYPNGDRPNRAAASGYWKATGTDKPILTSSGSQCLGVKKALVFYQGRPPKGTKTDWVMLEYRLLDDSSRSPKLKGSMRLDDWVLCRVRQKTNSPFQVGEKPESFSDGSPSFNNQWIEDHQVMKRKNELCIESTDYRLLDYLMGSPQGSTTTVDRAINTDDIIFQGTPKRSCSDMASQSQAPMVSSFHQMIETIKRTLSITALDEEYMPVPPNKRLNTSSNTDAISFEVEKSSLTGSTSIGRSISGFLV